MAETKEGMQGPNPELVSPSDAPGGAELDLTIEELVDPTVSEVEFYQGASIN